MNTVTIKPLEWRRLGLRDNWVASQDHCHLFYIARERDSYLLDFYPRHKTLGRSVHLSLMEAQSAAQLEWETFVRAATQP